MFSDMHPDQREEFFAISQLRSDSNRSAFRLLPLFVLILFGFTPIAYLILYQPVIRTLPDVIQGGLKYALVYALPLTTIYVLWKWDDRRKKRLQRQVLKMEQAYKLKWK